MKITRPYLLLLLLPLALGGLGGCAGTQSFTTAARGGETVALALGYRHNLKRENITVTVTDSALQTISYSPGDSKVRGLFNLYPDPASKLIVGFKTGQDLGVNANGGWVGAQLQGSLAGGISGTSGDSDWWLTTMLLDLPITMSNGSPIATGPAKITFSDSAGAAIRVVNVEILSGTSTSNLFNVYYTSTNQPYATATQIPQGIHSLERADLSTVKLSGSVIPYSVQMKFTHTPVVAPVKAWVTNPRGDLKSVVWSDDGTNLTVMVTPTVGDGTSISTLKDFKFYVAGGVTGLTLDQTTVKAYDINGSLLSGVTATVSSGY